MSFSATNPHILCHSLIGFLAAQPAIYPASRSLQLVPSTRGSFIQSAPSSCSPPEALPDFPEMRQGFVPLSELSYKVFFTADAITK